MARASLPISISPSVRNSGEMAGAPTAILSFMYRNHKLKMEKDEDDGNLRLW